ncbi:MAG: NUDIX hydrolase [bacterium]|nr:NUDIX hydrolase [bacterium]
MGSKSAHPENVLSQKAAILDNKGNILLVRRSISDRYLPGIWEFPGGKADPGSSLLENLRRELSEEIRRKARIINFLYVHDRPFTKNHPRHSGDRSVVLFYKMRLVGRRDGLRLSDEHSAFKWVRPEKALKTRLPPGTKKALRLALS